MITVTDGNKISNDENAGRDDNVERWEMMISNLR